VTVIGSRISPLIGDLQNTHVFLSGVYHPEVIDFNLFACLGGCPPAS
jgi:hypothetical protein